MSFNRKQMDNAKRRNPVAKNDYNRGGVHGKSEKAKRTALKTSLSKMATLDDWEEIEEEWENEEYDI